jgi:DNA polymerase-3 subunit gamma/tau
VVSFSGKNLTRKAVTENLNVLDYDTYFSATNLILKHDIPSLLLLFNKTLALGFDGHHFISGLASHFRDLMVCKHQETIELLEVGDTAKKNYLEQSKQTSNTFLLQALNIANDCDLKYKTSKNQRLLVELSLMKLASIDFGAEKKNPESIALANSTIEFIAPAAFYRQNRAVTPNPNKEEIIPGPLARTANDDTSKMPETIVEESLAVGSSSMIEAKSKIGPPAIQAEVLSKPIHINTKAKRVSGLSISSLKAKKQHQINKIEVIIDESELPKEAFTEEDMQKHWNDFVKKIDEDGRKLLASSLSTDVPKLSDETTIWIELPNDTMKKEVEREKFQLMEYLQTNLNNQFIILKITVNEEVSKKFAFTPEEKYQKLREKNPAIDVLRKTFDLDL